MESRAEKSSTPPEKNKTRHVGIKRHCVTVDSVIAGTVTEPKVEVTTTTKVSPKFEMLHGEIRMVFDKPTGSNVTQVSRTIKKIKRKIIGNLPVASTQQVITTETLPSDFERLSLNEKHEETLIRCNNAISGFNFKLKGQLDEASTSTQKSSISINNIASNDGVLESESPSILPCISKMSAENNGCRSKSKYHHQHISTWPGTEVKNSDPPKDEIPPITFDTDSDEEYYVD